MRLKTSSQFTVRDIYILGGAIPARPLQTFQNKQVSCQKLTFFFCPCSFSEALEGLRLNIFFLSGPSGVSLGKKPCERHAGLKSVRVFCHCAVAAKSRLMRKEKKWLHRSAEAERKLRGHRETGEADPVFGSSGVHTGRWLCCMCRPVLRVTNPLWQTELTLETVHGNVITAI